ncbi:hypothetical protein BCR34DRAFT_598702 [Clohesyomyces aquaticus]|uniref:Uncharacterized protein n=1 Tax=Clohesyomyces aquaticus TaxID=1231657 RepID=A0A1Y1ZXL9_9PLEO|nr:hypothetical protein BCR34DRAFT_598702 [Clohesyomyces aquaticus]
MTTPFEDPASLLWKHQLKREHAHLLDRIKKLETRHEVYDERIKVSEMAARNMQAVKDDMHKMAQRIAAIESDDDEMRKTIGEFEIAKLSKRREDDETAMKMQQKLSALESQCRDIKADFEQVELANQAAMKKAQEMESKLSGQGKGSEKLARKNDPNEVANLMSRLDAMESRRNEEVRQIRAMQTRVVSLEKTCQSYGAKNGQFHAEVTRLSAMLRSGEGKQVPSSEATTVRFESSNPAEVQVPASPLGQTVNLRGQAEYSPTFSAHQRRTARNFARPSQHEAQIPQTQIEVQTQTPKEGRQQGEANEGKKRKAPATYSQRQTRSQAQPKQGKLGVNVGRRSKIVVLKVRYKESSTNLAGARSSKRPTNSSYRSRVSAKKLPGPASTPAPSAKRKRRDIPQPDDMETFIAAVMGTM